MIDARRLPVDIRQARELAPRALLVLLTLVAVTVLYNQPLVLSALAVGIAVMVAVSIDQRLLIPLIVLLLPLEIGGRLIPFLQTEATATQDASALSLARIGIIAGALLFTVQAPGDWWKHLPRSSLYLPLLLLLALYVLALSNSQGQSGAIEDVARLVLHLAFFFLIAVFVRDRQTLRWVVWTLIISGLVLALIGIFQQVTDTYLWNEALATKGIRRNATFVNSNFYARFLVISMVMTTALIFREKSRLSYVLLATFVFAALALPFTSSRSNWMAAVVLLPLVVLMLPISPTLKVRSLVVGAVSGLTLLAVAIAAEPALADRVGSLASAADVLADRSFLIRAGWQMFLDHPLFGIGLDGFDDALAGPYSDLSPEGSGISHNSVITVLSELGVLGLIVVGFFLYRFGHLSWHLYRDSSAEDQTLVAGLVGAFLVIVLHSQFGERFLEDPYLWLLIGLMVALANIRRLEARSGDTPRAPDDQ